MMFPNQPKPTDDEHEQASPQASPMAPAAAPSSADVLEAAKNCLTSQQKLLNVAGKLLSALAKSPGSSSAETLARLLTPLCADYGAIARKTRRH